MVMETIPGVMILKVLPTEVCTKPKFVRLKCLAVKKAIAKKAVAMNRCKRKFRDIFVCENV